MKDPTRIPAVIDALHQVWEAQPDRSLAELWGTLENRGLGWATSDEDLVRLLREELAVHPLKVTANNLGECFAVVDTESPHRRVSIDPESARVSVRAFENDIRATTWTGGSIVRLVVGAPLVIRDASGIDHRLGVVRGITLAPRPAAVDLSGMRRRELGDAVYGATVARASGGGWNLVTIAHAMEVHEVGLRAVETRRIRYETIDSCRPGAELVVTERGGARRVIGQVSDVFPLEP